MKARDSSEQGYRIKEFVLLHKQRRLLCEANPVRLTPIDMSLLIYLVEHRERVCTKTETLSALWSGIIVEESNISSYVYQLRGALGQAAIATMRSTNGLQDGGYRFAGEVVVELEGAAEPGRPDTNLPQRWVNATGRAVELAELADRLRSDRLVTLAGPGGVGKTRLAAALGWQLLDRFPGGVWLVDVSPLVAPDALISATGWPSSFASASASMFPPREASWSLMFSNTRVGRPMENTGAASISCRFMCVASSTSSTQSGRCTPGMRPVSTSTATRASSEYVASE